MKTFFNILTLIVFTAGTIQLASISSSCKMMSGVNSTIACACSSMDEDQSYLSSEGLTCCSTKKFEKDRVQDFLSSKEEISKLASFQINLKISVIHPQISPIFKPSIYSFISPPKSNLPILNSSLII